METAARTTEAYVEYNPTTRVYSYSNTAVAEALPKVTPIRENETRTRVNQHVTPAARTKKSLGRKVLAVIAVCILGASLITLMVRYAMIANSYTEVNRIRQEIELTENDIASLNVELNTSVNIEEAREAAVRAGMGYPTADQIIDVNGSGDLTPAGGE